MPRDRTDDWYRSAFSRDYLKIYAHRDQTEAQRAIATLVGSMELPPQSLCLDLCCGFGRHIPPLEAAGLRVIGCDLSMDLLASSGSATARLVRGNMKALPFLDGSFDAVFSFFTSFGYFADDSENQSVIEEIARTLTVGGCLVMDYLNPDLVRNALVTEDKMQIDELDVVQRRWINDSDNTVNKELIVNDGEERRYRERVKLYGREDFDRFFDCANLSVVTVMGDYDGCPYSSDSKRQIYVVVKS